MSSSPAALSKDASDTILLVKELKIVDEATIGLLQQLFSHRIDSDLVNTLLVGKEKVIAVALFKVASSTHASHLRGYVLRFLADLVQTSSSFGEPFGAADAEQTFGTNPAAFFFNLVSTYENKSGIMYPALFLAASALRNGVYEGESAVEKQLAQQNNQTLQLLFSLVKERLSEQTLQVSEVGFPVSALCVLARRKRLRSLIVREDIISYIPRLLTEVNCVETANLVQFIYETLVLVWLLSFEYDAIVALDKVNVIPLLHRILQRVQKEKCVRVALMTLQNLINAQHKYVSHSTNQGSDWVDSHIYILGQVSDKGPCFISEMVGIGMLKTMYQLSRRKFGDEDITVIVESLCSELEQSMDNLTSFTEYRGEVLSGTLEWTPVHTTAKFWKDNALKFDENGYEVLQKLGELLFSSRDNLTLAVACYDLGELVRHHPSGRQLLTLPQMKGVKEHVMGLMSNPNPEVAKNALLAVQKIMVQRWEFIQ